jgi:6-phosphogluconolactonase
VKKVELISFTTADELAQAAAAAWLDEIAAAKRADKKHCVALSGGRIAQTFFAAVVEEAKKRRIGDGDTPSLPSNVHFFWADERCVPPADPESNFAVANQLLFAPLKISDARIHRIRGESPPDEAAKLASAEMRQVVSNSGPLAPALSPLGQGEGERIVPVLDIIFLGMGEDGHVASLFPGEPNVLISDRKVYRAVKNSPKPPPNRVTLNYTTIAMAKQVWVLVSGPAKEAALRESLAEKGRTPLAQVTQFRTRTRIFSDFFCRFKAEKKLTNF